MLLLQRLEARGIPGGGQKGAAAGATFTFAVLRSCGCSLVAGGGGGGVALAALLGARSAEGACCVARRMQAEGLLCVARATARQLAYAVGYV